MILETKCCRRKVRNGVSLLEVLVAIGIAVVGLWGIASLIPLAGRQAVDSHALTQAASASQNTIVDFATRGLHRPTYNRPWLYAEDESVSAVGRAELDQTANYYSRLSTPAFLSFHNFRDLIYYHAGIGMARGLDITKARHDATRWGYCIDPMFWSSQPRDGSAPITLGSEYGYRRTRFPYYLETLNPLVSPRMPRDDWEKQPRMLRVTYAAPDAQANALPQLTGTPASSRYAETLFAGLDDLVDATATTNGSGNATRDFFRSTRSTLLQQNSLQEITWLATLVPMEIDSIESSNLFTLSLVVFHRRTRGIAAPSLAQAGMVDPDALPRDERIAWASIPDTTQGHPLGTIPPSDSEFVVGSQNGFDIQLIGNASLDSNLRSGQWLMLSRRFYFPSGLSRDIHKWYRIGAVSDQEPITAPMSSLTDPFGTTFPNPGAQALWKRIVRVYGSDWIFSTRSGTGLTPYPACPTTATLIDDIVHVYETAVEVPWQ